MAALRRIGRIAGKVLRFIALLVAAGVVLALLGVNLPVSRRFVAREVTSLLAETLNGKIAIDAIGRIRLTGVSGVRARLLDPKGRPVLAASGVSADIRTLALVRSLFGNSGLEVHITRASVDHVDASLDADPDGLLRLLDALSPPPPDPKAAPATSPSRPVRLTIDRAGFRTAWVHGRPSADFVVDSDLAGADATVTVAEGRAVVELRSLGVVTRGLPDGVDVHGGVRGRLDVPPAPAPLAARASFDGTVGGATATLHGSLDGDRFTARIEAKAPPDTVARFVPGVRPREVTRVTVDARGDLPRLDATVAVRSGIAAIDVAASGRLGESSQGTADVTAEHVDLGAFLVNGPASNLNARVHATATLRTGGKVEGKYRLETRPAEVEKNPIPAVVATGTFTEHGVTARADVAEPGALARVDAGMHLTRGNPEVSFDATVSVPDLRRVRRARGLGSGSASVRARGAIDLGRGTVRADVSATLMDTAIEPLTLREGAVVATVEGPLDAPRVDATITGRGLVVAGRAFEDAKIDLDGDLRAAKVAAVLHGERSTPDVDAIGRVELGDRLVVRDARLDVGKPNATIRILSKSLRFGGGAVDARGVTIEGAGEPVEFDVRVLPAGIDLRATSKGLDVGAVARALGMSERGIRGQLSLDVDLRTRRSTGSGKLDIDLTDAAYGGVSGLALRVDASVDGRSFVGKVRANVAGGHVIVEAEKLLLGGSPLVPRSWEHATGHVTVDTKVDAARLSKVLPPALLPFDDMAGSVAIAGEFTRDVGDASPETTWTVHTDGFRASAKSAQVGRHDGTTVRAPPSWHVADIDLDGTVSIAKELGRTKVQLSLRDQRGNLVTVDGSADVPYAQLLARPAAATELATEVPFEVRAVVPRRKLSKLPPILSTAGLDGDVELRVDVRDTLRAPHVAVEAFAHDLQAGGRRRGIPVDVHLDGKYGDGAGKLTVEIDREGSRTLELSTDVRAKVADFLDAGGGSAPWDATLKAKVSKLPLDLVRLVGSRRVKGSVSGDVDAALGTRTRPHLRARLTGEDVGIARATTGSAAISVDVDERSLAAKVRFDQPGGYAEASASAGLVWKTPLEPAIDPGRLVQARADAKAFRVAVLSPFVQSVVRDLDGKVDADARFEVMGEHGTPKLAGSVLVDQASFELAGPGQELRDVHAKITLGSDGTLRAADVRAHGPTGTLEASGEATFDGIRLKHARLDAKIPKSDPFPVTIEGQSFAHAYGNVKLEAKPVPEKHRIDVTVEVPKATVELLAKSAHDLQSLDHEEHVRIGYHRTVNDFIVVPLERPKDAPTGDGAPTVLHVALKLGDIEVDRGSDLRARLEGQPVLELGEQTNISGQIRLRSGFLFVQGKRFEIESGTISFTGEPDNPDVVVTAGWTAPEGSRVYADFVGPLKSGKVTLRSEPAHTKSEILSLILFGSTDGGGAGSSPSPTSTGLGVAGGVMTQGLNKALDDMTGLDITTRIDTSESANPRPELEVRVARDVTVAVAHVIGVPPPGTNPDLNLATIDWRFSRNWSLDTTVGDQGSSMLDLVWQYRY